MSKFRSSDRPLRVLHSHPTWLPQTQPWLYNLVRHLPEAAVESHIVVERTENLEQFSIPRLHALSDLRYWRFFSGRGAPPFRPRPPSPVLRAPGAPPGAPPVPFPFVNICPP